MSGAQGSEGTEVGNTEVQSVGLWGDTLRSKQGGGHRAALPSPFPTQATTPTCAVGENPRPASCLGTERTGWTVLRP